MVGFVALILVCREKIRTGHGGETYRTGHGYQFNYVGALVLTVLVPAVMLVGPRSVGGSDETSETLKGSILAVRDDPERGRDPSKHLPAVLAADPRSAAPVPAQSL